MYVCIYIYIYTYICIYVYIYIYTYIHTYMHACIHTYIHTYTCMYVCVCVYIYIYIYITYCNKDNYNSKELEELRRQQQTYRKQLEELAPNSPSDFEKISPSALNNV